MQDIIRKLGISPRDSLSRLQFNFPKGRRLGNGQGSVAYAVTIMEMPPVDLNRWAERVSEEEATCRVEAVEREVVILFAAKHDLGAYLARKCAMMHQDDPFAPKILDYMPIDGGFVYALERLTDLNEASAIADPRFERHDNVRARAETFLNGFVEDGLLTRTAWGRYACCPSLQIASPYVAALIEVETRFGLTWDLHSSNMMARGDHLVITDPLYSSSGVSEEAYHYGFIDEAGLELSSHKRRDPEWWEDPREAHARGIWAREIRPEPIWLHHKLFLDQLKPRHKVSLPKEDNLLERKRAMDVLRQQNLQRLRPKHNIFNPGV